MFRISAFQNAEEFNEIFGKTTHGNGVVSRRNKILLAFYKSKNVWDYCREHDRWDLLGIKDMAALKYEVVRIITREAVSHRYACESWSRCLTMCYDFCSPKYQIDHNGICLDGTSGELGFVRYISKRNNKVYKMAAGKWFNHLITVTEFGGKVLPQQVVVWLCEQLVAEWKSYVSSMCPEYTLHVSSEHDDFRRIYDEDECVDDFHSCMAGQGFESFYYDAVKSKAAWLEDEDGGIVARCIIFTDVIDEDGKKWRLAERQYSSDCDDLLKRQLVNALIKAGEIDGYKQVGVDCGSARSFLDNDGNSLRDKKFQIECRLERDDTLSYQDSFKWFNYGKQIAYNYRANGSYCDLEETQGYYEGCTEYDEYHDEYCRETVEVHYQGNTINCNIDRLDDFIQFDFDYYHEDEIVECPECGRQFPDPDLYGRCDEVYSSLTDQWYCSADCLESAEDEFKEENWFHADIDNDYVENEDELSTCLVWNEWLGRYQVGTVITDNIPMHIKEGTLCVHNGVLVDDDTKMLQDDRMCEALEQVYIESQSKTA